ncbi:MAG: arginine--tRNA ligase [Oscillospiraceae bacterium]|nr:arginine--tRNA ligase [Oscillospiraceae bacterium]
MSSNLIEYAKEQLREKILESLGLAITNGNLPAQPVKSFTIEIPASKVHGDLATNIAMVCAKSFKMSPIQIAQIITENMNLDGTYFERYNIVSPGFINIFLKPSWFKDVLADININKQDYGRSKLGEGKKVMVEFVSANPTGVMHLGNARGGVLGDCLASVLETCGFDVTREFYVNDAGNQIFNFGRSLEARYLQIFKGKDEVEFPEDGYHGQDILELAKDFAEINSDKFVDQDSETRRKAIVEFALPKNIDKMKNDLKRYKIEYDVWFKESSLYKNNLVNKIIEILKQKDFVFEKDGAIWYKASELGGEKDEVLVRANGFSTYFAADIAYHYNKFVVRNFDKVINIWGADHHGHVARLKGAMDVLGIDSSRLDIILNQLVRLTKDGQVIKMSKRTGKSITLVDLLDEVPVDAARFFFNMREAGSHLDFDLDLAVKTSSENPVYYVQYAHARICSILSKAKENNINLDQELINDLINNQEIILETDEEKELIKILALYPSELESVALSYDCSMITKYAVNLASSFHRFYNSCKVISDNLENLNNKNISCLRLLICESTKIVLRNVLNLIKIEAPEKM